MKKYDHIKEKAVELRQKGYSLTDICKMLNRGKTTVYYWIKNVEVLKRNVFLKRQVINVKRATIEAAKATRKKFKDIHETYRKNAEQLWESTYKNDSYFNFFLICYLTEGDRKDKFTVGICNSDLRFMRFCLKWFRLLNRNNKKIQFQVQMHVDQNENDIKRYWRRELGAAEKVTVLRKSNTGKMHRRNWNSKYGVLSIRFFDAYIKTMINTWMELIKNKLEKFNPECSLAW